ncbi:MAG: SpoIID/LytB domain-containing protein [Nocardioides sp.]
MRTLASVLGLALVAALTAAQPAYAADAWDVPEKATITIKGHGYGHGHGMSQYGAEGAAREGLSFEQIAEFYYPGTTWGSAKGRIRVQITADTTDDLIVVTRKGLTLRDLGSGETFELPDKSASRWRVMRTGDGSNRVSFYTDHWRAWRTLKGEGAFTAGGEPVTLVTPSGNMPYRGRLAALTPADASAARVTVNTLRLEQYLRGVVPLEIPALWTPAAVQAQSVAARTYASYERAHPRASIFDICDTWSCQVYGGVDVEHPASDDAITATRRKILRYDGEPAFTQFGSSSGGWTSAGSVPYLTARADPYDGWSGNPNHDWSEKVSDAGFESAWPGLGNLKRIVVGSRDGNGDWGGRVRTLRLVGSKSTITVSGDTMRSTLGLRSTWVTFRVR